MEGESMSDDYDDLTAEERFRMLKANEMGFEMFGLNVDAELIFLSKIIESKDMKSALNMGIKAEWFQNKENKPPYRDWWDWMLQYHDQHGQCPTIESFSLKFGSVGFQDVSTEPYTAVVQHFREVSRKRLAVEALNAAQSALKNDVDADKVFKLMESYVDKDLTLRGHAPRSTSAFLPEEEATDYLTERMKNKGKMLGVPSGYIGLDSLNRGFRPGQLITIVGEKKRGKSFLMLWMARNAYVEGFTPAFVSLEMSDWEIRERFWAMHGGVYLPYVQYGEFDKSELKKLKSAAVHDGRANDFILNYDRSRTRTVEDIGRLVNSSTPRPEILFIDGAYLLQDNVESRRDASPTEKLMKITQGFKALAQDLNIPIVISTQAAVHKLDKSRELDEDSAAWSSSYGQDSDLLLNFYRDSEDDSVSHLKIALARAHASGRDIRLRWQFHPKLDLSQISYGEDYGNFHSDLGHAAGDLDWED